MIFHTARRRYNGSFGIARRATALNHPKYSDDRMITDRGPLEQMPGLTGKHYFATNFFAVKWTGTCEAMLLSISIENRMVSPSTVPL